MEELGVYRGTSDEKIAEGGLEKGW